MPDVDELEIIERWVSMKLNADATIKTAPYLGDPLRVYAELAPPGAAYPCAVIQMPGMDDVLQANARKVLSEAEYDFRLMDVGDSYLRHYRIGARLFTLLHGKFGYVMDGPTQVGRVESCVRLGMPVRFAEVVNGVKILHMVYRYSIRAQTF